MPPLRCSRAQQTSASCLSSVSVSGLLRRAVRRRCHLTFFNNYHSNNRNIRRSSSSSSKQVHRHHILRSLVSADGMYRHLWCSHRHLLPHPSNCILVLLRLPLRIWKQKLMPQQRLPMAPCSPRGVRQWLPAVQQLHQQQQPVLGHRSQTTVAVSHRKSDHWTMNRFRLRVVPTWVPLQLSIICIASGL